jgi:hypothetical protein
MARPKKKEVVVEVEDDDLIGTVGKTDEEGTPMCPIDGGFFGDKAEAVVDWWYANHPELAAAKYAKRKTHRSE